MLIFNIKYLRGLGVTAGVLFWWADRSNSCSGGAAALHSVKLSHMWGIRSGATQRKRGMTMTIEKLKKMLEDEVIDQAEYDESLEKFGLKDEPDEDPLATVDEKTKAAIQKMIQSERDRVANKLGNEKKAEMETLKEQLERIKREKLTEEERKAAEAAEKEAELERQKKEFQLVQNKYTAAQALKKAGLDNDDEIVELVLGEDIESTTKKVTALSALVERLVKAKVEEKFKDSGRDPRKGGSGAGADDNPWAEGHINYSKQMEIEATEPEKAKMLKAAAKK